MLLRTLCVPFCCDCVTEARTSKVLVQNHVKTELLHKLSCTAQGEMVCSVRALPLHSVVVLHKVSTVCNVQVPEITLHVSPSRLTQILQVMEIIMPASDVPLDPAPWVRSAEYTSTVDALTWSLGSFTAQWQSRFAVVYRGTLYLMQAR